MKFDWITRACLLFAMCLLIIEFPVSSGTASSPAAVNPFLTESTLPFHTPPFDKIKDTDYAPAIEAGMKGQLSEIEAVANNSAPPTFANTFEAMERSGALLTRVT
jgi:peptidyl-dipeptidase Dcp